MALAALDYVIIFTGTLLLCTFIVEVPYILFFKVYDNLESDDFVLLKNTIESLKDEVSYLENKNGELRIYKRMWESMGETEDVD
jgi:hypothetical protein